MRRGYAHFALPQPWIRGDARYEDGAIVLTNPVEYQPYAHKGYVDALSQVRTPADAVEFARRFGLLRRGPGAMELREPYSQWEQEVSLLNKLLRLYVTIQTALDEDAPARRRRALDELWEVWQPAWRDIFRHPETDEIAEPETDEDLLFLASTFLAVGINYGLEGTQEAIDVLRTAEGEPVVGHFDFFGQPPHLLGIVYHELAMLVVSRAPMRYCEECGRAFVVVDQRQRYCGKSCANRPRYKRWDAKRRQGSLTTGDDQTDDQANE